MCGICGIVINNMPAYGNIMVKAMNSSLSHRGPNDNGVTHKGNFFLGHTRLSILDLEGGKQPMTNENRSVIISYNGELYNYLEIRSYLISKGHQFLTNSDTEVILKAYEEWGEKCVLKFRGMFAFAIADHNKQLLFLARDHIGIKPLFYTCQNGLFAFASELQALKKVDKLEFTINPDAIDDYLWFQYIPAPNTIFKEISKLEPGNYIVVNNDGQIKSKVKYWDFKYEPNFKLTWENCLELVENKIKSSVEKHLVSDVPFGAFLSGGIDSSLIVTYMSQLLNGKVKTFSIGFENQSFDELKFAEIVARKCNTEHYTQVVKPEGLEILPKLVKHYGEPFGDSSCIPTYYVSKMAAGQVKMVLSGDGGDESFIGYHSYKKWFYDVDYLNIPKWKKLLYPLGRKVYPHKYLDRRSYKYWIEINRYFPYESRLKLWKKAYTKIPKYEHPYFRSLFEFSAQFDHMQKAQFSDLKSYLPFDILTKVDVASMINSLEVRTPLVDKEIWEMISKIPNNFHYLKNEDSEFNGKSILKEILGKYYSRDFVFREKMGFSVPIDQWLGDNTDGQNNILEIINENGNIFNFFEKKEVEKIFQSGYGRWKWLLLYLEFWLRDFYGN